MNIISIEVSNDSAELRKNAFMLTLMADAMDDMAETYDEENTQIEKGLSEDDSTTSASPPPEETNTNGVELDEDGLPWDARINTPSKLKLKRGNTWKIKPRTDPELIETVHAELREALAAAPATVETKAVAPPPAETKAVAPPPAETKAIAPPPDETKAETLYQTHNGNFSESDLVGAGWTTEAIYKLPIAPADTVMTFPELMKLVTPALASKSLTDAEVIAACNSVGLAALPLLAARPDLIQQVKDALF